MTVNLKAYKDMLTRPWGKLMYDLIFAQLGPIAGKTILDFGAGFCITAEALADQNEVTAIEPNPDLLFAKKQESIHKIKGSLEALEKLPDQAFDMIICHNVLEYVAPKEHAIYLAQMERLLKPKGQLSLIKHNQVGKVLHAVIFEHDYDKALDVLNGQAFESLSFAAGQTYSIDDLLRKTDLKLQGYRGLRTCYELQSNEVKAKPDWLEALRTIELAICDQKPYKDMAFFQHLMLIKA